MLFMGKDLPFTYCVIFVMILNNAYEIIFSANG